VLLVLIDAGATHHVDVAVREYFRPDNEWGPAQARLGPIIDGLRPSRMLALCAISASGIAVMRRTWLPLIYVGLASSLGAATTLVAKFAVSRPDPYGEMSGVGGSFPSGHVIGVLVFPGLALLALTERSRWWQWSAVVAAALLMAWALLLSAAHWLTDVAGAGLLGVTLLVAFSLVPLRFRQPGSRRSTTPDAWEVDAAHRPTSHDGGKRAGAGRLPYTIAAPQATTKDPAGSASTAPARTTTEARPP
jgi:membrane-associated phospholipid phosphatase